MTINDFKLVLLSFFLGKLLWNVLCPVYFEWVFIRKGGAPHSFHTFLGLEILILILYIIAGVYSGGSMGDGFWGFALGGLLIVASYLASVFLTRLIRRLQ